jgi:hypothetical protein
VTSRTPTGPVDALNVGIAALATAASFLLASPLFAASLALGATLEAVNFRTLRRTCEGVVTGELPGGMVMVGFFLRFTLLGATVGVALYAGAHPVALLLGLSLIVPSVIAAAWRVRPAIQEAGPAPDPDDASWDDWDPWLARERDDDEDWS